MRQDLSGPSRRTLLKAGAFGGILLGGGGLISACGGTTSSGTAASSTKPAKGGTLRLGMTGGSSDDTADADNALSAPDFARVFNMYTPLVEYDKDLNVSYVGAQSITSSADAKSWTIKVRPGMKFSNGREVGADDVAYSLQRIMNPKDPMQAATPLAPVEYDSIKSDGKYTVTFTTTTPFASLAAQMATYHAYIVPTGYNADKPIGSGPFVLSSYKAGSQSVLKRNPYYYKPGLPYLDEVVITEFSDYTALTNALLSGQVDAIAAVPASSVPALKGQSGIEVFSYDTAVFAPFVMNASVAPFTDVRVRQAFRLIVDRPQVVTSALDTLAMVGNDHVGMYGPYYNTSLPQRKQDIAQAKSLLRAAGQENLSIELTVLPETPGTLEMAEVFQQNAKQAGVTVTLTQPDYNSFVQKYGSYAFTQDYWQYYDYMAQAAYGMLPKSAYNAGHWDSAEFAALYEQANAEVDETKRKDIVFQMQKIEYEQGTNIIASYNQLTDVYKSDVQGMVGWKTGYGISGSHFEGIWLS